MEEENRNNSNEQGGIIVISSLDPLSKFWTLITGNHYTIFGFYSTSSLTGFKKTLVTLVDAFNLSKPIWIKDNTTLDQLMNLPYIQGIKIRPIKDKSLIPKLKLAIAQSFNYFQNLPFDKVVDNIRKVRKISLPGQKFINLVMSLVVHGQVRGFHSKDLDKYFEPLETLRLPKPSDIDTKDNLQINKQLFDIASDYFKELIINPIPFYNHPGAELLINIFEELSPDSKYKQRLKIFLGLKDDKELQKEIICETTDICVINKKDENIVPSLTDIEIKEISDYIHSPKENI